MSVEHAVIVSIVVAAAIIAAYFVGRSFCEYRGTGRPDHQDKPDGANLEWSISPAPGLSGHDLDLVYTVRDNARCRSVAELREQIYMARLHADDERKFRNSFRVLSKEWRPVA